MKATDRSNLFHEHESDLMRSIRGATQKFKEEPPSKEILDAIKQSESPQGDAEPKKKRKKPKVKNVHTSIYIPEDKYKVIRECAYRKGVRINKLILDSAWRSISKMRIKVPESDMLYDYEAEANEAPTNDNDNDNETSK